MITLEEFNKDFVQYCHYIKPVNKNDFIALSNQPFFSLEGKTNAELTLKKFENNEDIIVDYNILIKRINFD